MILERILRRLLVLYPAPFRAEFEEEMVEFFRDRMREAARKRGPAGAIAVFLLSVLDIFWNAALERSAQPRRTKTKKRKRALVRERIAFPLRSAMSTFRHRPVFAASVVATLALGIAANTAVFSVVDAVLLRPLPYGEPQRIVTLWNRYDRNLTSSSPPDFLDRRRDSLLLESVAAIRETTANLALDSGARRVRVSRVTADFFQVMGVDPLTGPVSFPSELEGAPERLAVLSFGFWRSVFGGEEVTGRRLRLDGESYLVSGIMPESFDYPPGTEVFVPLVFTAEELSDRYRGNEYLTVLGRARPGVSLEGLEGEMNAMAASVLDRVPDRREFLERNRFGASVVPLRDHLVGKSEDALTMLFLAVFVVLLATGGTVSHLLLSAGTARGVELSVRASLGATRGALLAAFGLATLALSAVGIYSLLSQSVGERRRELGVRMALGASRAGILGLVLREGVLLLVSGSALGALATIGVSRVLEGFLFGVARTDAPTYLASAGLLAAVALTAALVPAWRASRSDPLGALRAD